MGPAMTPDWMYGFGGKSRRRSIACPWLRGQSHWQIVPNIQKSGKLKRLPEKCFNPCFKPRFWMKTACNGWRSSDPE
jgi:hypothetical protein